MGTGRRQRWNLSVLALALARCVVAILALGAVACRADGQPGDLLSKSPIVGAPDAAAAWRIRYRTLDEKGAPVESTGIVIVPRGPAPSNGRDIVSWGRGTVGLAPVCAPSKSPNTMFEKTPGIPAMLKRGYVIAASDFADPDSTRVHPYLVGLSEAHAMLDVVRAARQIAPGAASKRFALWGESEGAHAALWAAKLAPAYAPDLDLVGAAVAAPPTDLIANFDSIKNPAVRALMTGYVSYSWSEVYGIPLSTFANPIGRLIIRRLSNDCTRFDGVSAFTDVALLLLSHSVPGELREPWTKPLKANSIAGWPLAVPLLVAQGGKDDVVVPDLTRKFEEESCADGVRLRSVFMPDAGHLDVAEKTTAPTVAWIAARFSGAPAESDCSRIQAAPKVEPPIKSSSAE